MELMLWTNMGKTMMFKNVINFSYHTQGFEFDYVGVSTGKKRHASFNNTSVIGYATVEENKEEPLTYDVDDAVEFIQSKFNEDGKSEVTKEVVKELLSYDEAYMSSVGIIQD